MTTAQAADYLGLKDARVRQLVRANAIPATREETPRGPVYYLNRPDVEAFKQHREEEAKRRKEGKLPGRPLKGSDQGEGEGNAPA